MRFTPVTFILRCNKLFICFVIEPGVDDGAKAYILICHSWIKVRVSGKMIFDSYNDFPCSASSTSFLGIKQLLMSVIINFKTYTLP
ncbi:Uncharacterised protein [Enterobacter cloacae]|nr:Uncharacterised protein [Enterobacter cloacae]